MWHAVSYFRDEADAADCVKVARAARTAEDSPSVGSSRSFESKWWVVGVDSYIGSAQQKVVLAIRSFAARMEIADPERARCGDVHGEWMDPVAYMEAVGSEA